jgi:N-acyl-D-amino-acid deacylase
LILDIHAHGGASAVFHSMNEEDLRVYLSHTNTMIGADSSVREFKKGVPHPRGYGNNARVLSHYVRELNLLSLEEAIRRMTSLPAKTFRLTDRGEVREGYWADLVLFDPNAIESPATFEAPHQYATGFTAVIVNGEIVVDKDRHTQARPGRILKRTGE